MSGRLRWESDGRSWPNREASRFVETRGLTWHLQQAGGGPVILLLHGTGASAHSWRDLVPLLARDHTVIAPDLPGHGFTRGHPAAGLTLAGMGGALAGLLARLEAEPVLIASHSAGAAIALQLALDGVTRAPILGFNPAVTPFPGLAAQLFPAMARLLFVNPFAPRIFAQMARVPGETGRFLKRSTGSRIDEAGIRCYETLLGNSRHCAGALEMMANWDLAGLQRGLPGIANRVLLVHSRGDVAIPLPSVRTACELLPDCRLETLPRLGHLAHEEDPQWAARTVREFLAAADARAPRESAQ